MEIIGHLEYADLDQQTIGFIHETRRKTLFHEAFLELGEKCQELMKLYYQGKTVGEIADLLGVTKDYVAKRKDLCRTQLFEHIS